VAFSSTIFSFAIDLSDADRHVYETLSLRVARQPSESNESVEAWTRGARLLQTAVLTPYTPRPRVVTHRGVAE
jgi:uncharacterized protein YaeQ